MPTNLALDDTLIEEAVRVSGLRTKKAAVTSALEEYIARRRQKAIIELFGKIDMLPAASMRRQRDEDQGADRRKGRT